MKEESFSEDQRSSSRVNLQVELRKRNRKEKKDSLNMGCALSSAEKEAVQRSLAIDKTLATENATKQNEIKLLLLGKPIDLCALKEILSMVGCTV